MYLGKDLQQSKTLTIPPHLKEDGVSLSNLMNDSDKAFVRDKIMEEYYCILSKGYIPDTQSLKTKVIDALYVGCFDLVMPEGFKIEDMMTEQFIHNVLSFYKNIHYYGGRVWHDSQKVLLNGWQRQLLLLEA